jgi:hypothetical protein
MMTTYLVIILLFCAPLAVNYFAQTFFPEHPNAAIIESAGFTSPFAAAFAVPLDMGVTNDSTAAQAAKAATGNWPIFLAYVGFSLGLNVALLLVMIWMFNTRWRVAG